MIEKGRNIGPIRIRAVEEKYNILENEFNNKINTLLMNVNLAVKEIYITGMGVVSNLEYARKIFLSGRGDFIETFFYFLEDYTKKDYRPLSNRSMGYILDSALINTFGKLDKFTEKVDVCILENENRWDYISLFCQLDFPINLILTREVIMKFVAIFKLIWRIKKIENLLKRLRGRNLHVKERVRVNDYTDMMMKMYFYIFEESISIEWKDKLNLNDVNGLLIDNIRKGLNETLDSVMHKLFQVPKRGREELDIFLSSLESFCIFLGKSKDKKMNDDNVKNNLRDFIRIVEDELKGTSLCNLEAYVR
jgi:hypothetical protein